MQINIYKGIIRPILRKEFFKFLQRIWTTQEVKDFSVEMLKGLLSSQPNLSNLKKITPHQDYPELGKVKAKNINNRSDIIFITGRFRSGTTLLWNIFRNIDGLTAYYEPFNERRWFDPKCRGENTDDTHIGVSNYWEEYNGLEFLKDYYDESWIYKNLYMGENFWDPKMKRYIELLIESASGRPVLQFNRVDFRLPWLKANFPNAKIIHIYRNPRDQWCSFLRDIRCFSYKDKMVDFAKHDKFYLLSWCEDLKYHFPFLDPKKAEHPYELFYSLWYLSFIFGKNYSDFSLKFELLVQKPKKILYELFEMLDLDVLNVNSLSKIISKPALGKWRDYADKEWFANIESQCENYINEFISLTQTKAIDD